MGIQDSFLERLTIYFIVVLCGVYFAELTIQSNNLKNVFFKHDSVGQLSI